MDDFAGLDLILSIIISGIGFVFFSYGKKMTRVPQIVGGLILMVYPYFVTSALWMALVAIVILALIWGAIRLGW